MKTKFKSTPRYTELRLGRVLVTWWKSYRRLTVRLCRRDSFRDRLITHLGPAEIEVVDRLLAADR